MWDPVLGSIHQQVTCDNTYRFNNMSRLQCLGWYGAGLWIVCLQLQEDSMATSCCGEGGRDLVLATLQQLGIAFEIVPYSEKSDRNGVKGTFCKNLLLKDRKGQFYLVVTHEDKAIDLKWLKRTLNAHRNFSFASKSELKSFLLVNPGSVSPLALICDTSKSIRVVVDEDIIKGLELLHFHPMDPAVSVAICANDLFRYLAHHGYTPEVHSFLDK